MIDILKQADEALFLWLHHLIRGESANEIMWLVSDRWIWIPMYAAILAWLLRHLGWKKTMVCAVCVAAGVTCADQTCASLIRPFFERMRPAHPDNPLSQFVILVKEYRGGSYGFPSCHAANTFMLAVFMSFCGKGYPGLKIWMFFWAFINCISRVYLGVHYPGDLLFGALIGSGFGVLWWWIYSYFVKKLNISYHRIRESYFIEHFPFLKAVNIVVVTGIITLIAVVISSLFTEV